MAEDLLEVVEKLQSRLTENQEPRKLLKTLKRLEGLPMTIDILVETGVGKSVNSLRKHETVGPVAKSLVARWKMLVPQPVDRPPAVKEARGHTRGGESGGRKRHREPSPEQPRYEDEHQDEEMLDHQQQEEEEEEEGGSQYHTGSPSSPLHHQYSPQRVHRGHHSDGYESPHAEEEALTPPLRKEARHSKQHREPGRAQSSRGDRRPERRHQHGQKGGAEGKKRSAEGDRRPGAMHKSSKHGGRDMKKEKRAASEAPSQDRRPSSEAPRGGDEEEAFETPTMSFESFLTYDDPAPSKKKKKPSRPGPPAAHATPPPPKPSKTNGMSKRPDPPAESAPEPPTPERRRKVIDVVPTLPDIPLPAIQPNYRPLPSIEVTPLSPQRRKVPVSCDEEDAGFTGRRLNTKMSVYSGAKTTFLPKMISLYEQCIRVLQNNIDSIDEVGGVPYEILEPVLERCTPEQLYRIEQCNQCFMEETDELWMRHCQRDFKHGTPQEYESWREMYLRLHDEREERLRMLTQNISSAHANRPKGRQVKMAFVNSVAKPPRDVRRRQEKFGTTSGGGASGSGNSAAITMSAPAQMRTAALCSTQPGDSIGPAETSVPPPPRFSTGGHSSSGGAHSARDKPQVKKIAPMMAKTIKAFKNRFSRR